MKGITLTRTPAQSMHGRVSSTSWILSFNNPSGKDAYTSSDGCERVSQGIRGRFGKPMCIFFMRGRDSENTVEIGRAGGERLSIRWRLPPRLLLLTTRFKKVPRINGG